jgi:hypothetical protein
MSVHRDSARLWLVDGFNLLHACFLPEGPRCEWWLPGMRQRVCSELEPIASRYPVWVVFDGHCTPRALVVSASLVVQHAPNADDFIARCSSAECLTRPVTVVTADRSLADRCRQHGADVLRPWALAEWLRAMRCASPHT